MTEAFKDAANEADRANELLRRARRLLIAGDDVAMPSWFDEADELASEIEAHLVEVDRG